MIDLYMIGGAVLAAIAGLVGVVWKAYRAGQDNVKAEKAEDDAQMRLEFDKIDSRAPNLDDSLNRLRERSNGDRSASPKQSAAKRR